MYFTKMAVSIWVAKSSYKMENFPRKDGVYERSVFPGP